MHIYIIIVSMNTTVSPLKSKPSALAQLNLSTIDTLVFAGGGNRCIWQAGLMGHLLERGWQLPLKLVATSAGAGVATALLGGTVDNAMRVCRELYNHNPRVVDWSKLWQGHIGFAHSHIYPAWMASYLNEGNFEVLRKTRSRLTVAFTRPAPWLGVRLSALVGTMAYAIEKQLGQSIHPRLPKWLGLRQGYMDLQDCQNLAQAQDLLFAASAAPPFMQARHVLGAAALDGGFVDNAPIAASAQTQTSIEKSSTLVLLTRSYPQWPSLFEWQGRNYWQPSQKVPVSTWNCTPKTTIEAAYELGAKDAQALVGRLHWA
jgi:predicted patatin/cPLA2 family phospholipase